MTKKRVTTTLFIALVLLTLISFCFLGTTFARYTSGGKGSASVEIAEWDIDVTGGGSAGSMDISLSAFSPSMAEYNGSDATAPTDRANTGTRTKVATIANSGDVDATVTITFGAITFPGTLNESAAFSGDSGDTLAFEDGGGFKTAPSKAEVAKLFTISVYTQASGGTAVATITSASVDANRQYTFTLNKTGGATATQDIYVEITWQSADNYYYTQKSNDHAQAEQYSDGLDTWVGQYVPSISFEIGYTAVQASEADSATA